MRTDKAIVVNNPGPCNRVGPGDTGQIASAPCEYLPWDSEFFACRIGRVLTTKMDRRSAAAVLAWCQDNQIDCIYFLADSNDPESTALAEENDFHLTDIRITLERRSSTVLQPEQPTRLGEFGSVLIRLSRPQDIPALCSIARTAYYDSRFFFDRNFPFAQSQLLYETWIEKNCNQVADAVLVAEYEGQPAGYLSCIRVDECRGQMGLLGVRSDLQGRGFGSMLIHEAMRWFAGRSISRVSVVTQGRNCSAQRLYQRCGFVTTTAQLWYHRWSPERYGVDSEAQP